MPLYPRIFFDKFVKRSVHEFVARPDDEYLAHHAVQDLNILAERYWHYWRSREPALVHSITDEKTGAGMFRTYIGAHLCSDFRIVRDVAEAHKHAVLTRKNPAPEVPTATHTTLGAAPIMWFGATGSVTFTTTAGPITWTVQELRVNLANGRTVPLLPAVQNTYAFLKGLIDTQPPARP